MKKILLVALVLSVQWAGACWASGFEAELSAGSDSILGGVHAKRAMANGFWRGGANILVTDDDDLEYKWLELDFTVGSDTVRPGLSCEVGVKGVMGDAEDRYLEGDIGALAFACRIGYLFSQNTMPIPIEVFAGLAYAPEILSFQDADSYLAFNMGMGLRIVQNASILLQYCSYDVEMDQGPGEWDLDDDMIRIGLAMRF